MARKNTTTPAAAPDDERRYLLAGPGERTVTVHGSAELAHRLAEANRTGVGAAFRRLDPDDDR